MFCYVDRYFVILLPFTSLPVSTWFSFGSIGFWIWPRFIITRTHRSYIYSNHRLYHICVYAVYIYIYIYIYIICMHACMYVCVYISIYTAYTHIWYNLWLEYIYDLCVRVMMKRGHIQKPMEPKLNHVETGSEVNGREWQNNGPHNKT